MEGTPSTPPHPRNPAVRAGIPAATLARATEGGGAKIENNLPPAGPPTPAPASLRDGGRLDFASAPPKTGRNRAILRFIPAFYSRPKAGWTG